MVSVQESLELGLGLPMATRLEMVASVSATTNGIDNLGLKCSNWCQSGSAEVEVTSPALNKVLQPSLCAVGFQTGHSGGLVQLFFSSAPRILLNP